MEKDYMKKQFVTYEIALALKEMGFDEECFGYYYDKNTDPEMSLPIAVDVVCQKFNLVKAPLYQQLIDWFREKHNIHISIPNYYDGWMIDIRGFKQNINIEYHSEPGVCLEDYEEAREQAILKCIELCKSYQK